MDNSSMHPSGYLGESLLPQLNNVQQKVAAESLRVEAHLAGQSFHLNLGQEKKNMAI